MELTTERLVLRDYRAGDLHAVQVYASDPEVCRYVEWGPNDLDATASFLARVMGTATEEPRSTYELAITTGGELVGGVGLRVESAEHRRGNVGWVVRRDAWGKGYATEAAREVIRFAVEDLRLHRIEATCDPSNGASARVMEKAGMTQEGRLRDHMLVRGRWRDSLLYAWVSA